MSAVSVLRAAFGMKEPAEMRRRHFVYGTEPLAVAARKSVGIVEAAFKVFEEAKHQRDEKGRFDEGGAGGSEPPKSTSLRFESGYTAEQAGKDFEYLESKESEADGWTKDNVIARMGTKTIRNVPEDVQGIPHRDANGKLDGIISFRTKSSVVKLADGSGEFGAVYVSQLAARPGSTGVGFRLFLEAAKVAADRNLGMRLDATPFSQKFYEHVGMKYDIKPTKFLGGEPVKSAIEMYMTPEDTKNLVRKFEKNDIGDLEFAAFMKAEWREELHPRDRGKFAPSEGIGAAEPSKERIAAAAPEERGAMIALYLPIHDAQGIAVPGGNFPEEMHVTLAYLGKGLTDAQLELAGEAAAAVAREFAPVETDLQDVEIFDASDESDGKDVAYASVGADLTDVRARLLDELAARGIEVDDSRPYVPHVTIAYVEPGEDPPPFEPTSTVFGDISVAAGGEVLDTFDFSGVRKAFDESEPRDESGKWTTGGGAGAGSKSSEDEEAEWTPGPRGNAKVYGVMRGYLAVAGFPSMKEKPPPELTPARGTAIALEYERAKSNPDDPEVKASYAALADEVGKQFDALEKAGINLLPWDRPGQPYANSKEMREDLRDNGRLYYFKGGTAPNPLMPADVNDKFRAVHDVFGHAMGGNAFTENGEVAAFVDHAQAFSPKALAALATETLAQASWFNHSERNAGKPPRERDFADQKAVLLDPRDYAELVKRMEEARVEEDDYASCPLHARRADVAKDFDEDLHPRGEAGKFAPKGGGSARGSAVSGSEGPAESLKRLSDSTKKDEAAREMMISADLFTVEDADGKARAAVIRGDMKDSAAFARKAADYAGKAAAGIEDKAKMYRSAASAAREIGESDIIRYSTYYSNSADGQEAKARAYRNEQAIYTEIADFREDPNGATVNQWDANLVQELKSREDTGEVTEMSVAEHYVAKQKYDGWMASMNGPAKEAFGAYKGASYMAMNGRLRDGYGSRRAEPGTIDEMSQNLNEFLQRSTVDPGTRLYRGWSVSPAYAAAHFKAGKEFVDKGFMSTSADPFNAAKFQEEMSPTREGVFMEMTAAGDLRGGYTTTSADGEKEFTLAPGVRVKITSSTYYPRGNRWYLKAEITHGEAKAERMAA